MSWSGDWVRQRVGVLVHDAGLLPGLAADDLVGLALRINPKRPHLLVSRVLAKHVPTDPRVVRSAGLLLGLRAAAALGRDLDADRELPALLGDVLRGQGDVVKLAAAVDDAVATAAGADGADLDVAGLVLGYAETATGLGHLVARALGLPVIHSTRRRVTGYRPVLDFEEAHSHATEHLVLAEDPALLTGAGPVVLVDDELSTGRTALNTIRALHAVHPRSTYVIAALVDMRRPADRERMAAVAAELGVTIEVVALASGEVVVPDDAVARVADLPPQGGAPAPDERAAQVPALRSWPVGVREGGRHGFTPADEAALERAAEATAAELSGLVGDRVLVLGTEELMHAPLMVADALQRRHESATVRFSSTTRSPVQVRDSDGYAVRSGIAFGSHDRDADAGERFAYNVASERWSDIVVVLDAPSWSAGVSGLLEQLAPYAASVRPVVLPVATGRPLELRGPEFGSYAADEVTWLLKDLSHVRLEADLATRERAIQSGEAHYAESLPVEYQPEESYRRLFHEQLDEVAERVATAVGTVTELAMATRGRDDLVLVSLARAGTPIGVLMRRWARRRGLDWPHYTISIVRDRGIDLVAMRHLADRYDPARILFVDGWTGKGAITREFAVAVEEANAALGLDAVGPDGGGGFRSDLAVLADPGECVELYGTRDDFLIPSACLNSTVSGLVSRTVLNRDLIGPDDFHGAKFYADLAAEDVSGLYLDRVAAEYDAVADAVAVETERLLATDRTPTWVGWQAAERIRAEHGLPHINLVKPGVGETTRVLLRRVPWKVVVNPERRADLRHVELLAAERGVEVVPVEGLPYSCVGLIRPTEKDSS
ncbi:phosphoribosyltransferase [Nocardioides pacificus]